jgi:hypothetical protein
VSFYFVAPPQFDFIQGTSLLVLVMLIGATYAIVAPILSAFALLFFVFAFSFVKYQVGLCHLLSLQLIFEDHVRAAAQL